MTVLHGVHRSLTLVSSVTLPHCFYQSNLQCYCLALERPTRLPGYCAQTIDRAALYLDTHFQLYQNISFVSKQVRIESLDDVSIPTSEMENFSAGEWDY